MVTHLYETILLDILHAMYTHATTSGGAQATSGGFDEFC